MENKTRIAVGKIYKNMRGEAIKIVSCIYAPKFGPIFEGIFEDKDGCKINYVFDIDGTVINWIFSSNDSLIVKEE